MESETIYLKDSLNQLYKNSKNYGKSDFARSTTSQEVLMARLVNCAAAGNSSLFIYGLELSDGDLRRLIRENLTVQELKSGKKLSKNDDLVVNPLSGYLISWE